MSKLNIIIAHHFRIRDGVFELDPREYTWYIPRKLLAKNVIIEKGDIVKVVSHKRYTEVLVVDVRTQGFSKKKRYKPVLKKLDK